ncbi:hypothetical protein GCM10022234_20380 [Aeromicrobium panaciterrae]|uniref:hypothetical protein n=1 Tax=Aeromicrobium panaciterrae TaxID=363861 RepID=UPI0031D39A53
MSLTLCVQLWAVPGNEALLEAYEDEVLGLLGEHGARLLQRVRSLVAGDGPYEVQIIELPGEAALESYMADPRRLASADLRDRAVARTEIARVAQI